MKGKEKEKDPLGLWAAGAAACTWITPESTHSLVITPLTEDVLSMTRMRYLPGREMVSPANLA